MRSRPIGVGVIGASVHNPGWAMTAHIPAIEALPDFELRAISTSNRASADAAAKALGVPGYNNADELIADPGVDLVVVAVRVAYHHALTAAALDAGKMVFTEWPLARTLDEAKDLVMRAEKAGVRTMVGLQARFSPAVEHARNLVAQGYVGNVLATNLIGTGMIWGDQIPGSYAYVLDADAGAGVLAVSTMHALEALTSVLGEFAAIDGAATLRRPIVLAIEDGRPLTATAFDHVALAGRLQSGALASVLFRGAPSRGDNLRWEINGTEGDLVLTATNGNFQVADLNLEGARGMETKVAALERPMSFAGPFGDSSAGLGANTLRQYAAFARDLRENTRTVPDFAYALTRHHLLAAIEKATWSGIRQEIR
ncbi:Gfo/Idh/MocA family protein [Chelatococcus asaccharovorans]|uniref:Gfo/Idh/MocA family protein n=1 Tax=Chelatococcus asaccharovorans TaxID=28210 RepID=UPI00224C6AD1|nr:Gfo/Idh/MocA family oxidoreductase [Chelatococcus asaccharovorans]CAH1668830.1 Oxidoreductase [Chelatococcus asaccharovorans]CAH1679751.1 Oxidoreductase [Chelatococcus asaccharovorans]